MTCFQTFLRMMSSSHAHGLSVIAYNFKGECRKQQTDLAGGIHKFYLLDDPKDMGPCGP